MSAHEFLPGLGIDVGTSFLVSAKQTTTGETIFKTERDAFFTIEPKTNQQAKLVEKLLVQRGATVIKTNGKLHVVGQCAIDMANERNSEVMRPLKRGVISAAELDTFAMLAVVIEGLIGRAGGEKENCVYCFPADPVDANYDVVYHRRRLDEIFKRLGYNPIGILESEALVYSELVDEDLSGVAISCGAGMFNMSLSHMGELITSISVAKGGDWIDERVAKTFNLAESTVQAEKESGIDLMASYDNSTLAGRLKNNIVDYYEELINYTIAVLVSKLKSLKNVPNFGAPVNFVIGGGTSLADGFIVKVREALAANSKQLPFTVGEVRRAQHPLAAVAAGCLIYSQLEL